MTKETIREMLNDELEKNGDVLVASTMTATQLDHAFETSHVGSGIISFTAWGERFVYFPVQFDGASWIESVPRNPCNLETDPVGG